MFSPNDVLIECVPNFSEGQNASVIHEIQQAITSVTGVVLLNVDTNKSANRTVFTFIGLPESVCNAAYLAIEVASKRIDMRIHRGTHPRIGATDVCPLIPISNISIEETDKYAKLLAKRVGERLQIPVYCYEHSSQNDYRHSLEQIRKGEYEALPQKQTTPGWEPDFGPREFNPQSGATVIGARRLLIAFNVNLDTKSVDVARKIAEIIRQSGKVEADGQTGEIKRIPGLLLHLKAIGWYIKDFDVVQVSTNITNIDEMPIYTVVETIKQQAEMYGTSVTGCELIGMIPKRALVETGKYYAGHHQSSLTEKELIAIAIRELNLNDVKPFDSQLNILENVLAIIEPKSNSQF